MSSQGRHKIISRDAKILPRALRSHPTLPKSDPERAKSARDWPGRPRKLPKTTPKSVCALGIRLFHPCTLFLTIIAPEHHKKNQAHPTARTSDTRGYKGALRPPQDRPQSVPKSAQEPPKTAKERPRASQEYPRPAKKTPQAPKNTTQIGVCRGDSSFSSFHAFLDHDRTHTYKIILAAETHRAFLYVKKAEANTQPLKNKYIFLTGNRPQEKSASAPP